jgi:isocitrate/isopropylmalate dehydrogenase
MEFVYGDIGYEYYLKSGNQLPDSTIEKVKSCDAALFGAVTTPPNIPNYSSPILKLRRDFRPICESEACHLVSL